MIPSGDWLEQMNRALVVEGVAMLARPFEALRRWSMERQISVGLDSAPAKRIFEWFESRSRPGEHSLGPEFTGVFFFDGRFWMVEIPVFFGTVSLDPLKSMRGMPERLLHELLQNPSQQLAYLSAWAECLDYGRGFGGVALVLDDPRLAGLATSGDQEIRSAVSQLLEQRPNPKGVMSCRMATEMFLKAYAGKIAMISEKDARRIGHRLDVIVERIAAAEADADILRIRPWLNVFPEINSRYTGTHVSFDLMAECYAAAQFCGTALVRKLAGIDSRPMLRAQLQQNGVRIIRQTQSGFTA